MLFLIPSESGWETNSPASATLSAPRACFSGSVHSPAKPGWGRQQGRAGAAKGRTSGWVGGRAAPAAGGHQAASVRRVPPHRGGLCLQDLVARGPWGAGRPSDCTQQPWQSPAAGLGSVAAVLPIVILVSLSSLLKQKQIFLTTRRNGGRKRKRRDVCARRKAPAGSTTENVPKHDLKGLLEKHENLI